MLSPLPLTEAADAALQAATALANENKHPYVGTEHLLWALAKSCTGEIHPTAAALLLRGRGITPDSIRGHIQPLQDTTPTKAPPVYTPSLTRILHIGQTEGSRFRSRSVGCEHLLYALLSDGDSVAARIIAAHNVPLHELYGDVLSHLSAVSAEKAILDGHSDTEGTDAAETDTPERFGYDLTARVGETQGEAFAERDALLDAMIRTLCRKNKNAPCLIGEAGVGKTALVRALAHRILQGRVPRILADTRIFSIDPAALVAGAKYRGDFEERVRSLLRACERRPRMVLFIDEIHTLSGAGAAEGAIDAVNLLKPALSAGTLRLIGATTPSEYARTLGRDRAMERRLQTIYVPEPDREETFRMLCAARPSLEEHHGVRLSDRTLRSAIEGSVRYLPARFLPDKAIDVLDEAAAEVRLQAASRTHTPSQSGPNPLRGALSDLRAPTPITQEKRRSGPAVTPTHVFRTLSRMTGIPIPTGSRGTFDTEALERLLRDRVVGQDRAVQAVLHAIRRQQVGLSPPGRPIASFLFVGPTGVGKTALAKALAEGLFGDPAHLIRFDMSEYGERHSLSRLIGAPPGYVGYESGGVLTEALRHTPYAVLLFDEIEKAHPDILHLFLQMLDEGRLTDGHGMTADLTNTVIVMTSNAVSAPPRKSIGFSSASVSHDPPITENALRSALTSHFSPEFLARPDGILYFSPLTETDLGRILDDLITALSQTLSKKRITLTVTEKARAQLLVNGNTAQNGARLLRRTIARELEDPITDMLLSGTLRPGDGITFSLCNGVLRPEKTTLPQSAPCNVTETEEKEKRNRTE